jgi:hemerythrin-like domain-containing protein
MTHIFDLLHEDHQRVTRILNQLREDEESDSRAELVEEVRRDLEMHATFEESEVYPEIEKVIGEEGELKHAVEEHDEAIRLIERLAASVDEGDEEWAERLEDVKDAIEHHVEEEEKEFFAQARKKMSKQTSEQLARQYKALKEQIEA